MEEKELTKMQGEFTTLITSASLLATKAIPPAVLGSLGSRTIVIEVKKNLTIAGQFIDPIETANSDGLLIRFAFWALTSSNIKRVFLHELFHAIHYSLRPNEPSWIREGLAELFVYKVTGKFSGAYVLAALETSTTPLESSFNPKIVHNERYGHAFLYFYYIDKNCGGTDLYWKLVTNEEEARGPAGIDSLLKGVRNSEPYSFLCRDFKSSATFFEVARFYNRKLHSKPTAYKDILYLRGTTAEPPLVPCDRARDLSLKENSYFRPIYTSGDCQMNISNNLPWVQVWISRRFPFEIVPKEPNDPSSFDQLLFLGERSALSPIL
jgi:hypothetical protein